MSDFFASGWNLIGALVAAQLIVAGILLGLTAVAVLVAYVASFAWRAGSKRQIAIHEGVFKGGLNHAPMTPRPTRPLAHRPGHLGNR